MIKYLQNNIGLGSVNLSFTFST